MRSLPGNRRPRQGLPEYSLALSRLSADDNKSAAADRKRASINMKRTRTCKGCDIDVKSKLRESHISTWKRYQLKPAGLLQVATLVVSVYLSFGHICLVRPVNPATVSHVAGKARSVLGIESEAEPHTRLVAPTTQAVEMLVDGEVPLVLSAVT
jgi:hypothetical protein